MSDNQIESFKVVLLGESGVGKTSIISQFIDNNFQEDLQSSTGGTFSSKSFVYGDGKILKFEIWDTAGQERYRALTKMFYKDANAAILVYDITRKRSYEELQNYWVKQIQDNAPPNIIVGIVANKSDLSEEEEVDEEEAREFSKNLGAFFCTTSAKNRFGIEDLFLKIAQIHVKNYQVKIKNEEEEISNQENQNDEHLTKNGTMKISKEKTINNKHKKKKCC